MILAYLIITVFKAFVGNVVCNVELDGMNFWRPDSMSCRRLTPCLRLGRPHYIVPCILWREEKDGEAYVITKCVLQIFVLVSVT